MKHPLGGQGIGDQETEILLSRLEKAQIDIINEFDNISKNNGFRNDVAQAIGAVRPSALIQVFPEIGVVIPKGSLSFGTGQTSDQSFDELATVYVVGTFEAETATNSDSPEFQLATESLIQDFAAVWANITTKNILTRKSTGRSHHLDARSLHRSTLAISRTEAQWNCLSKYHSTHKTRRSYDHRDH